jgi:hypothetical protein
MDTEQMATKGGVARLPPRTGETDEITEARSTASSRKGAQRKARIIEKKSPYYHHRESCPPMSMDDPTDSPFTSESESEGKEAAILKRAAIARQKAHDKAASDKKTLETKRRRQNRAANQPKQQAAYAAVYKAREAVPGFKKKPRASSPTPYPTDGEEQALAEAQQVADAQAQARAQALRFIEEDEEIGSEDDDRQFRRPTFTNEETKKTYEYKPAQPGRQDWDSAHDDRCAPVLGCCEWQGKR